MRHGHRSRVRASAAVRHAHAALALGRDDAIALSLGGFVMGRVAHDGEAARVLELQPGFTVGGTCAAFDIHPSVAVPLSEALGLAGLPS